MRLIINIRSQYKNNTPALNLFISPKELKTILVIQLLINNKEYWIVEILPKIGIERNLITTSFEPKMFGKIKTLKQTQLKNFSIEENKLAPKNVFDSN
jgi:hypothetical protein